MANRDRLRIIYDILCIIQSITNCNISKISRNANLSHYAVDERLALLIKAGLLTETSSSTVGNSAGPEMRIFTLTHKGHQFHSMLVTLFTQLQDMGIQTT